MRKLLVGTIAAWVAVASCQALAQDGQQFASPLIPPKSKPEMPHEVQAAWACVGTGTLGTLAAVAAGSENLINVVAGGIVVPQNRAVLILGLTGVVFTTFCTLGQQLLPLYQYYTGGTQFAGTEHETAHISQQMGEKVPASLPVSLQVTENP